MLGHNQFRVTWEQRSPEICFSQLFWLIRALRYAHYMSHVRPIKHTVPSTGAFSFSHPCKLINQHITASFYHTNTSPSQPSPTLKKEREKPSPLPLRNFPPAVQRGGKLPGEISMQKEMLSSHKPPHKHRVQCEKLFNALRIPFPSTGKCEKSSVLQVFVLSLLVPCINAFTPYLYNTH